MSTVTARHTYRVIELHLIDEPSLAVRQSFDEAALYALADDIRTNGLLQPIGVKPIGDRFEVVYGHRRRIALGMIQALDAPCVIVDGTGISPEALKIKENKYREDINPGDEAIYLAELLETECGSDTDALAALIGESREYVESRLLLLRGDERVFAALRDREHGITFSVARELNMVRDPAQRAMYLDAAVRGGVSAKVARQWRLDANTFTDRQIDAGAPPPEPVLAQPPASIFRCVVCGSDEHVHEMDLVYLHRGICTTMLKRLLGEPAA